MISIVPYHPEWPIEFRQIAAVLRQNLGELALRIDHIGSTSVPGLMAKDVIDIQITAFALTPAVEAAVVQAGYLRSPHLKDHLPPGREDIPEQWEKWVFKQPAGQRRTNVHVRMPGRANQRYALLFRDYLRAFPAIAEAYGQVKAGIVKYHPEDDMEAYYDIKDPACDLIMGGAEFWAKTTGWQPGPSDA